MEFLKLTEARCSVRSFSGKEIEQDKLDSLLRIVNSAPSAGDLQSYEIVVVKNKARIAELAEAAGQGFIKTAPAVLVFCADPERAAVQYGQKGASLFCVQDATIAAAYAQLAAVELGLASTWVGAFDVDAVSRAVGSLKPVCLLPIGYAAELPERTPRRPLNELVHYEHL